MSLVLNKYSPVLSVLTDVSEDDTLAVAQLIGRTPGGLKSIAVRSDTGSPVVIQVSSLVKNKPFPTLFWLVDKQLNYQIDVIEATGFIAQCQAIVDASPGLQADLAQEHRAYIKLRDDLMSEPERQAIEALGFADALADRGIGGIQNFTRIRCLHTHYAAHLVQPNTVGAMVDRYWRDNGVAFHDLSCIG